jgi:hypothetical protein
MTPLVCKIIEMEYSIVEFDPLDHCLEYLISITSEPSSLNLFLDLGGDFTILENFVLCEYERKALLLDTVLINIMVRNEFLDKGFFSKRIKKYSIIGSHLIEFLEGIIS